MQLVLLMNMLAQISWPQIWYNLVRLGVAYALSLPLAYDRERAHKSAELRTFPLVAVALNRYEVAILMITISFPTLRLIRQIKPTAGSNG